MTKILKLNLYQPFAHYRESRILQDSYIPTLNLPAPTTIAGMIAYTCDHKFNGEFDIAIIGNYKMKDIHFVRGEEGSLIEKYQRQFKSRKKQPIPYIEFKSNQENRIMNFEVLYDVFLTVFLKFEDEEEYCLVKERLEHPTRYMALGRKEDFVVKQKKNSIIEDVTDKIQDIEIINKEDAIENGYKIKNTYIPVDLFNNNDDDILSNGVLYCLPRKYSDIKSDKTERKMEYSHYVCIDNNGYYPQKGRYICYESEGKKLIFKWLVKEGEKN